MFFTVAIRAIAAPVVVPVAQAPIEYALMTNGRRIGNASPVYPAMSRCTASSSRSPRGQLNGRPDEPADSSTTTPRSGIRPSRHRAEESYAITYPRLSVSGKSRSRRRRPPGRARRNAW